MNGKGSKRRPAYVKWDQFSETWDDIFKKPNKKKAPCERCKYAGRLYCQC